jgi:hypothetical protein
VFIIKCLWYEITTHRRVSTFRMAINRRKYFINFLGVVTLTKLAGILYRQHGSRVEITLKFAYKSACYWVIHYINKGQTKSQAWPTFSHYFAKGGYWILVLPTRKPTVIFDTLVVTPSNSQWYLNVLVRNGPSDVGCIRALKADVVRVRIDQSRRMLGVAFWWFHFINVNNFIRPQSRYDTAWIYTTETVFKSNEQGTCY